MNLDKHLQKDKKVFDLNRTPIHSQKDKANDKIMTNLSVE